MSKRASTHQSLCGLSRRSLLQSTAALLSVPFVVKSTMASAQDKLAGSGEVVYFSFGGSFTEEIRRYVFDPFTKATGIKVVDVTGGHADASIKAMNKAGRIGWDMTSLGPAYPDMSEAGMFAPIEYALWDAESVEGLPPQARRKDATIAYSYSMVLAYDQRAFPNGGPKNWADLWNVNNFPGPRGLYATEAKFNYVAALLAAGLASKDIWPLTGDKLDHAFDKLSEIKPHVAKWWAAGGEAPQLLINGEYAATGMYDGRAISAMGKGVPIKFTADKPAQISVQLKSKMLNIGVQTMPQIGAACVAAWAVTDATILTE
ncbi:extracellular solute-binding protein [Bradyrhizobium sp. Arg816]|uniref:extracellular solute-binding protein n=1 Tax=Bradyrhizobium sp. Arg816 TaxID=2998491 RepID=UPI00249E74CA|nr:extracellular solute-binding protein [Bradyrhizobium sp. Arg816]MDI3567438.1 extracellular solute-binding protein [Bradyrhizobium sp. Arg816]